LPPAYPLRHTGTSRKTLFTTGKQLKTAFTTVFSVEKRFFPDIPCGAMNPKFLLIYGLTARKELKNFPYP